MDLIGLGKEFFGLLRDVGRRFWGTRTAEQDRLDRELQDAIRRKEAALACDPPDLVAANHWHATVRRLRDEAAAKTTRRA